MDVTRRDWMSLAAAAGVTAAFPLRAQVGGMHRIVSPGAAGRDYQPAIARLRAFAAADLTDKGFPGVVIALSAPDGFAATIGLAAPGCGIPVTPDQLFQIGSITKSLTAMALYVLADRGKLDLDAVVQGLLPDHPLPSQPITLTQLLEHSSGLPNALDDPLALQLPGGRLWTGFMPGSRYSYCNLGYALLGAVIERASGTTYAAALDTLVLKPLGMNDARPGFRTADRADYATGHVRFREDVPWLPGARLAPARWFEFHHAAGSVAATASDMVRYLQFVAKLARGKGAPLFSDVLAERFRTPTIASTPPGARYGNGLQFVAVEDRPCLRHTGGVPGFSSAFTLDRDTGVGAYASVNVGGAGGYRPIEITEYALALLRAVGEGRPLPPARMPKPAPAAEKAERYTGRWLGSDGTDLAIAERGGALFVAGGGRERPLRPAGETAFVTDHPALEPYLLAFDKPAARLLLGARLFARDARPIAPPPNPRLAALAGTYYNPGAWSARTTVFAIGDRLIIGTEQLAEAPDGSWRATSPDAASERIWFQKPVGGRPQVLNVSGTLYTRVHDRAL